jgi:hypothetical protein
MSLYFMPEVLYDYYNCYVITSLAKIYITARSQFYFEKYINFIHLPIAQIGSKQVQTQIF